MLEIRYNATCPIPESHVSTLSNVTHSPRVSQVSRLEIAQAKRLFTWPGLIHMIHLIQLFKSNTNVKIFTFFKFSFIEGFVTNVTNWGEGGLETN